MRHALIPRGIVNGMIGAAVVAAWFFMLDLANGRPLYTPAALGSALFLNAQSEAEIRMTFGVIAGFTALHVAMFCALGVLLVGVADYLERKPSRILMVGMAAIVLDGVMVPTLALTAAWVLGALGIWAVVVANILSVGAMVLHAWRTHPVLRDRLEHAPVDV